MPKHAEFSSPAIFLITIPTSFPPRPRNYYEIFLPFLFSYSCSVRYRRNDLGKKYDLIRPRVRPCVSAVAALTWKEIMEIVKDVGEKSCARNILPALCRWKHFASLEETRFRVRGARGTDLI